VSASFGSFREDGNMGQSSVIAFPAPTEKSFGEFMTGVAASGLRPSSEPVKNKRHLHGSAL